MYKFNLVIWYLLALVAGNGYGQENLVKSDVRTDSLSFSTSEYPGIRWELIEDTAGSGWSVNRLEQAKAYFDTVGSAAVMVIHKGKLVASWGQVDERYLVQSIRKSLLNALYGIYVERGAIDIESTLADLGIDDTEPPLTATERQARVEDLLLSRSGIRHEALYEVGSWKRRRLAMPATPPGTVWIYNNWDFNTLGTIFEQASGESIATVFDREIARPLQMEDFRVTDVSYLSKSSLTELIVGNHSDHKAYIFEMSTRDLARFGLLYLNEGKWADRQIIPATWIKQSFQGRDTGVPFLGDYGYLWWVDQGDRRRLLDIEFPEPVYIASGARGHFLLLIPYLDMVIAHQVATEGGVGLFGQMQRRFFGSPSVDERQFSHLVKLIVEAHPFMSQ